MPILAEEVSLYPDTLLDDGTLESTDQRWWVMYTKVRQEKALARELIRHGVGFFLPLLPRKHLYRGTRVESFVPMFTSYVFVFGNDEQRVRSLATNRVANVLPVKDQWELHRDLQQIQQLIEADVPLTVESRLRPGQRVRVHGGPFAGLEGVVEARCRKSRLVVAIKFLQQGVSLEIDDFLLEPID